MTLESGPTGGFDLDIDFSGEHQGDFNLNLSGTPLTPRTCDPDVPRVDCDAIETCEITSIFDQQLREFWTKDDSDGIIRRYKFEYSGNFEECANGDVYLTGTIANTLNADDRWEVYIKATNKRNWAEWSALGRIEYDPLNTGNYEDWVFYEVDNVSKWYGLDYNCGQTLDIAHMPSDYSKGMQIGIGANGKTAAFGISSWFGYSGGTGPLTSGQMDINAALENCQIVCNNVLNGGSIGEDESICTEFNDPSEIYSAEDPTGGYGNIEYIWWKSTSTTTPPTSMTDPNWTLIDGANGASYDPGPLSETTYFIRCSRRAGCEDYDGESNVVTKELVGSCGRPAPLGWEYTCEDGIEVDLIGEGIRCESAKTLNIPNPSNVTQIIAEVVYKGTSINPATITFTTPNESSTVSGAFTDPAKGYCYRTTLDPAASVTIKNINNKCKAQSFVLYVFRNTGNDVASSGVFVEKWLYHSSHCETLNIPKGANTRDVLITVPLSEITNDGRVAKVTATAEGYPSITETITINSTNQGDALNISTFTLSDVPAKATAIQVCVESPDGTTPDGQSFVFAGAVKVAPVCIGCDKTDLSATTEVISNYNGADISCAGAADGRAQVLATGGLTPYTYAWSDGQTGQIASDLDQGTHSVTVTDNFGCTVVKTITLQQPELLISTAEVTSDYNGSDISCKGASDGSVSVRATGGILPYEYKWDANANFSVARTVDNLPAGRYDVTVVDANGCTSTTAVTINDPAPISLSLNVTSDYNGAAISCNGASDAKIKATATGGTGAYSYLWNDAAAQTTAEATGLSAGNYEVLVTDANGCTANANILVEEPEALSATATVISNYNGVPISCTGASDGIAQVVVQGGVLPYSYAWSNGQTAATATDLDAINYEVTITDVNGCSTTANVSLTEPAALSVSASVSSSYNEGVDISTLSGNDGSALATASGGTGAYTYIWNDPAFQNSAEATSLSAGTYTVQVSDANGCTATADVTLKDPAKLGNFIWEDLNANGIQDDGEPGIAAVKILLEGTADNGANVRREVETDANGMYMIDGLPKGSYKITVTVPDGYEVTAEAQGGDPAKDSDIFPANSMSNTFTLDFGDNDQDKDVGLYKNASLGDYVWEDLNGNGLQDDGNTGIEGVQVRLIGTDGVGNGVEQTTSTDANGRYQFDGLRPGRYKVIFPFVDGFKISFANEGGDDTIDSDANPDNGMTAETTIISGQQYEDFDAGYYKAATSLGNYVWEDRNGNGVQEFGEPGIEGVLVTLSGFSGNGDAVEQSTTTNASGIYFFIGLAPGTYKVTFAQPAGFKATYPNEGGDDTIDSDVDPATLMTTTTTLVSGDNYEDFDAGFYKPSRLGDFVWDDLNANGIQDDGEPGIEGVRITLSGNDGAGNTVSRSVSTDNNGGYLFDDLRPGTYQLTFDIPTGFVPTAPGQGGDNSKDSDLNPADGTTISYTIVSGTVNEDIDAGLYKYGSIGNYTWRDCDRDGMQDDGEAALANVPVILNGTNGLGQSVNLSVNSDDNGLYSFNDLMP
ncbi:MAG: SdrD B-like domain-containing protein, partial [Bacteroidota bacterium]